MVFDTTLRDGEQSAGAAMRVDEKVEIAIKLEELGVDVIEAGFPITSEGDMQAVQKIAGIVKDSVVCALARAEDKDIDAAIESVSIAEQKRVHTFIATSPLHMEKKLGLECEQVIERATRAVSRAKNKVDDVEFSTEDAGRSEEDFLCRIIEKAIDAGATTINIPDTVGYTHPVEFASIVRNVRERVPNSDKAIFSIHCHNDLGLAVANSLAGIEAGARQVECTINGIGERAGNASLEEVVMAVRVRNDLFGLETDIKYEQLVPTSRLVEKITGMRVAPNKSIVGVNAFAHESGIHQDGVLKDRNTYEIMNPEDVGWDSNSLPLGKLSGRRAFGEKLKFLGHSINGNAFEQCFVAFKKLADEKRQVSDEEIDQIVGQVAPGMQAE